MNQPVLLRPVSISNYDPKFKNPCDIQKDQKQTFHGDVVHSLGDLVKMFEKISNESYVPNQLKISLQTLEGLYFSIQEKDSSANYILTKDELDMDVKSRHEIPFDLYTNKFQKSNIENRINKNINDSTPILLVDIYTLVQLTGLTACIQVENTTTREKHQVVFDSPQPRGTVNLQITGSKIGLDVQCTSFSIQSISNPYENYIRHMMPFMSARTRKLPFTPNMLKETIQYLARKKQISERIQQLTHQYDLEKDESKKRELQNKIAKEQKNHTKNDTNHTKNNKKSEQTVKELEAQSELERARQMQKTLDQIAAQERIKMLRKAGITSTLIKDRMWRLVYEATSQAIVLNFNSFVGVLTNEWLFRPETFNRKKAWAYITSWKQQSQQDEQDEQDKQKKQKKNEKQKIETDEFHQAFDAFVESVQTTTSNQTSNFKFFTKWGASKGGFTPGQLPQNFKSQFENLKQYNAIGHVNF